MISACATCLPRRCSGFTLLELLVVVSISTLIIATLTALYRMTTRTAVTLTHSEDEWGAEQFLRRQYMLVHPATLDLGLFEADEDSLAFVSYKSARHGENGPPVLARYRYQALENRLAYQEQDLPAWWETRGADLARRLLEKTDGGWTDIAFYQVDRAEFGFLVRTPDRVRWQRRWNDRKTLPQLIKLEMQRLGEQRVLIIENAVLFYSTPSGY